MSRTLHYVGPWDLDRRLACLPRRPEDGPVLLVESLAKGRALPWQRKKLVMVLSAMHHFAQALRRDGFQVEVRRAPTVLDALREAVAVHRPERVVALQPREWGLNQALRPDALPVPLELRPDGGPGGHFLLSREEFADWARGRRQLRMDQFYRHIRQRTGWLLEGGRPVGGKWSFDVDNRKAVPPGEAPPPPLRFTPDALTRAMIERVSAWPGLWGRAEGFAWPVTRAEALEALEDFVARRLPRFGDYQDAMRVGDPFLWHSLLSVPLNLGLLHPRELAEAALSAWERGAAPLNAVEGFLRQVIGWREFVRGVYWLRMPGLRQANHLGATRRLPLAYWEPEATRMTCLADAVGAVREHGYAHHIQRLMVLGNYALLAGVAPLELSRWFWAGFVDAYEWVELPNVHGMALWADPGFTTKPYAASGAYVKRMSDCCARCPYDVKQASGPRACPLNALFWRFMTAQRGLLESNPRLGVLYRGWDRKAPAAQAAILAAAEAHLAELPLAPDYPCHDDAG